MAIGYEDKLELGRNSLFGDGLNNGALYRGQDGSLMSSGMFSDSGATIDDAIAANDYKSYTELLGEGNKGMSEGEFAVASQGANSKSNWGMDGYTGAAIGLGGLALSYLGYKDQHETSKKNLQIMDQQIASNDVTAKYKQEAHDGLHNGWSAGTQAKPVAQPAAPRLA